jgi:fatty-acyl-CoA synthase
MEAFVGSPERTAPRFKRAHVPATGAGLVEEITVGDVLRRATRKAPDLIALKEGLLPGQRPRRWSYADLLVDAEGVARALLEHVDPGDKVAIWANNVPEWVLVQMGAALAGVTLVTVNPALRLDETKYVLAHSEAALVFHLDSYRGFDMTACLRAIQPQLPALRHTILLSDWDEFCGRGAAGTALPQVSPDDIAQIQYTSGTTGRPKGAALRHRGLVNAANFAMCRQLGLAASDSLVNPMPLFHTAGSVLHGLGCLHACATHVLLPNFEPGLQLALIGAERGCHFAGVPTMMRAMLDHSAFPSTDMSSVRFAFSGGATVEAPLAQEVESKLGVPLIILYALTECSAAGTMTSRDDSAHDRQRTVGRALPGVEIRVVDPVANSTVMPVYQVGEFCTRGYHVMAGYHDDPERTALAIDDDGWLHSGDLVSMDDRGYFTIEGRLNDMIIRGGENIYPKEIEAALLEHPAVAETAVVGVPDDHWGERVVAFVRLTSDVSSTADELQAFLTPQLAAHKIPKEWHFIEEFPVNLAGKVLKTELRKRALEITVAQ